MAIFGLMLAIIEANTARLPHLPPTFCLAPVVVALDKLSRLHETSQCFQAVRQGPHLWPIFWPHDSSKILYLNMMSGIGGFLGLQVGCATTRDITTSLGLYPLLKGGPGIHGSQPRARIGRPKEGAIFVDLALIGKPQPDAALSGIYLDAHRSSFAVDYNRLEYGFRVIFAGCSSFFPLFWEGL